MQVEPSLSLFVLPLGLARASFPGERSHGYGLNSHAKRGYLMSHPLKMSWLFLVLVVTLLVPSLGAWAVSVPPGAQKVPSVAQTPGKTCPQLPAHFDPLTASASEIHSYYLPPRPQGNAQLLAQWVHLIKSIKRLLCPGDFVAVPVPVHHPFTPPPDRTQPNKTFLSPYWSGYIGNGSAFDDVKGRWNTQCLGSGQQDGAIEATWVGIGGVNGSLDLAQTGTNYSSPAQGSPFGYHLFYEFTPDMSYIDFNVTLSCKTTVDAETYFYSPSNTWCTNVSYWNGSYTYSYGTCYPSSYHPDTSTAEWVDERPACSPLYALLADFNYTGFSNGYAHNASRGWHTIGGWYQDETIITNYGPKGGATLAQPAAINPGGTSFTDYWYSAGTGSNDCLW